MHSEIPTLCWDLCQVIGIQRYEDTAHVLQKPTMSTYYVPRTVLCAFKLLCYVLSHFSHVQLCDPMDCSRPGSSVHGILQTRILSPGDLPHLGIKPPSLTSPALASRFFTTSAHQEALQIADKSLQSCLTLCDPIPGIL